MPIIVVDGESFETSLEPTEQGGDGHDHTTLVMDDTLIQDGHITLIADPPKDGKFISCQKGAGNEQFNVTTNGGLFTRTLVSELGMETQNDGSSSRSLLGM